MDQPASSSTPSASNAVPANVAQANAAGVNSGPNKVPDGTLQDPALPAASTDQPVRSSEASDTADNEQKHALQTEPAVTPVVSDTVAQQQAASSDQPAASLAAQSSSQTGMPGQQSAASDQQTDESQQVQPEPTAEEPAVSLQSDIPVPANAVSGPLKEFGPPIAAPVAEVVMPSDAEPDIPQEVKEAGVEATPNPEQPNVPKAVQHTTGLKPVNDAVPVPTAPSDMISLPMPEVEAQQKIKTSKIADSIRWLATLVIEQAKRAHGQLLGK